jgi:uncharacterized protein (TIGR01777 family)
VSPRRIAISGASGLVGSALSSHLRARGDDVVHLVRRAPEGGTSTGVVETTWTPERGLAEPGDLEGIDALVHLAGESLAAGRFGASHRRRIRESRVQGTRSIVKSLQGLSRPPKVLLCASAAGYYGDRGAEPLDEQAPPGRGFLADVCAAWEQAARGAREARTRVICCRFGMVLAAEGGALPRMLPLFRMGLGGRLGDGRQYWPWIAIDDVVAALEHLLARHDLEGAVNVVAPESVTNAAFTLALGRVLGRLTWLAIPAPALRAVMGAGADELVLASARVVPARLQGSGFVFRYPQLEGALRHVITSRHQSAAASPRQA